MEEVIWLRDWESADEVRAAVDAWVIRYNEQRTRNSTTRRQPSTARRSSGCRRRGSNSQRDVTLHSNDPILEWASVLTGPGTLQSRVARRSVANQAMSASSQGGGSATSAGRPCAGHPYGTSIDHGGRGLLGARTNQCDLAVSCRSLPMTFTILL